MWTGVFFGYVCPSIGVVMSSLMFAAPVSDLRHALLEGKLGPLNPTPWAVMTGNCLGWIAYSYYTRDPFIFASNIPGILVSVWLNLGASKLQYFEMREIAAVETSGETPESSTNEKSYILAPQDMLLLTILAIWIFILVCVGWFGLAKEREIAIIGILVNINLLFFYGAPLQTIRTVVSEQDSTSIHRPTMVMNWINTAFWVAYGLVARNDPVIYGPNAIGLLFGLLQGVLCCFYPGRGEEEIDMDVEPLLEGENQINNPVGSAENAEHVGELV